MWEWHLALGLVVRSDNTGPVLHEGPGPECGRGNHGLIPCQWYTSQQERTGMQLLLEVLRGEEKHRSLLSPVFPSMGVESVGRLQ